MPDFFQPGPVISLPLLTRGADQLERDLAIWTRERPLALVLPCHVRDLENHTLTEIIRTLCDVPWVSRVVVGLDGAEAAQWAAARERFSILPQRCEVLWNSDVTAQGKGRNLCETAGQLLHHADVFAVAMHDCDIRTYSREFLARLCWPVLHPDAGLRACKGYYARSAGRLHGRVFRLLFQPLLRAWAELFPLPWVAFLQSFRYPLSGELCVEAALLKELAFDPGWGVEIRLLHSLFRTAAPGSICQAELCDAYDHKHQEAPDLVRMAEEVAHTLTMTMHEEGADLTAHDRDALIATCEHETARALREAIVIAQMNGMAHDAAGEAALALQFVEALRRGMTGETRLPCLLPAPATPSIPRGSPA